MEVVTGATSSLLPKLGGLLQKEYKLQDKVKKDIESLQKELIFMNTTLLMVAEVPPDRIHPLARTWATLIRELSYDMEDVVNTFMTELHNSGLADLGVLKGICKKAFNMVCMGASHHRIAGMIEEMKSLTKELTELRDRYRLDNIYIGPTTYDTAGMNPGNGNSSTSGTKASRTATYDTAVQDLVVSRQLIHTQEPVGADTNLKKLREWLTKVNGSVSHRSVLSIVGSSGVGKTTIATALYRECSNQFDCWASVTVSENFDADRVLRDILGQINTADIPYENKPQDLETSYEHLDTRCSVARFIPLICGLTKQGTYGSSHCTVNNIDTMNYDELVGELRWRLRRQRYLLLFDDIWSAEQWDHIRILLPYDNTKDSKIIVTTRFQAVGAACSDREGTDHVHTVDVLSVLKSRNLFNHSVCELQSSNKKEAPVEIWMYCGGLPLAIVVMAGLIACNPSKTNDHWSGVCKLFCLEQVAPLTLNRFTRILDCCFNDMPADLKTCSMYLAIFAIGLKISRKRLIRRWISERFVTKKQGQTAEEVAETYFNHLVRRKIIHAVEHDSGGEVKYFEINSMIHEYIVAKSNIENVVTVVGGRSLLPTSGNKVRRLSMQTSGSKYGLPKEGMNLSHVRSLTVFGSQNQLPFHSFSNGTIEVLDLEDWKYLTDKHLDHICKMVRLKYLSFRRTKVTKIPSKIEKLQHLETLDIRETNVVVLPKSFGQLKLLHTLLGGSKNQHKAIKLSQERNKEPMKALRILSGVDISEDSAVLASLHLLTGLKKLAIYKLHIKEGGRTSELLRSSIEHLCSCGLQALAINDEGSEFINSLDSMSHPPRYLSTLELSGKMERTPKWIENLDNLYKLTLSVTVLNTDTFKSVQDLPKLFSLTFTLSAAMDDQDTVDILEENKERTNSEIIVPPGGFKSLKLLRFFATIVPMLSFSVTEEQVMPELERIDMQFHAFDGIYGIETLKSLQEVHITVGNQADSITKFLVNDLKEARNHLAKEYANKWPKIIMG